MHGALFFLAFALLAWGSVVRLMLARPLLATIKSYFWASFFIGILFLFQHAAMLGAIQLVQIFPGLVLLISLRERFKWQEIIYLRPSGVRLAAAGLLFLALLGSIVLLLGQVPAMETELQVPLAVGLIVVALALSGIAARGELVPVFFFLALLFHGAALCLVALTRPDPGWEALTLSLFLVLAGPVLLGVGAYLLVLLERIQPGASRAPLNHFKF